MVERIGEMMPPTPGLGSGSAAPVAGGKDFAAFVKEAAVDAADTLRQGEALSKQGIAGKADLNDVVSAGYEPELTLPTVTTLMDKIVKSSTNRKSDAEGKWVAVRLDIGWRR